MDVLLILPLCDPFDNVVVKDRSVKWNKKKSVIRWINPVPVTYPNGLLSLAAYMVKVLPDTRIRILDFNLLIHKWAENEGMGVTTATREDFWNYCMDSVSELSPDLIGISLMFCGMQKDFPPLVEFLRRRFDTSFIVAGSHLASAQYSEELRASPDLDAVCFGEGEIPFANLLSAMRDNNLNRYLSTAKSWVTREKLFHDFAPSFEFVENLDDIPRYELDLIVDWKLYARYGRPLLFMEKVGEGATFHMFTSRGCPGRCVFCASHNVHGRKVRHHSIKRVKSDILYYLNRYRIGAIDFYDDHFLYDKPKAMEILRFMRENGIATNVGNPSFFAVDSDIAEIMREAGIEKTIIAVESANEKTLRDIIHKPGTLKRAAKAVRDLQEAGITVVGNILMGFPGETKEAIDECVYGMLELGCNWYSCFVVAPLPGSELFEICRTNGYFPVDTDIYQMDFKRCIIETDEFKPEYIERKVYETNLFVNFVNNFDMRHGHYERALSLFEGVLTDVIDTHAFACYFAALCSKKLGLTSKYSQYRDTYCALIDKFEFWRNWRDHFNIPDLP